MIIKILVVDDISKNLLVLEELLADNEISVLKANSGREALELLLVEDVALALVDIQMPEMNGFEFAELIRGMERTRHIPIIFITASASDPTRTFKGYEAGGVDFLYKPIDTFMLKSKVAVFIELYKQKVQLSLQLEQLKQSLYINEMFTAVLGHDLRSPLAAILNYAEVLKNDNIEKSKINLISERIKSSSQRMARMIEQILDMARTQAGGLKIIPKHGDILQTCLMIRDELELQQDSQRILINSNGITECVFDADRIAQVVSNLICNAIEHGNSDKPVYVMVDGTDEQVVKVNISNDGAIAKGMENSLFAPFKSSREHESGGLGLGLYIVSKFVNAHGGKVYVQPSNNESTTIGFEIPRALGSVDV